MGYPGDRPAAAAEPPRRRELDPPKLVAGKLPEHLTEDERRADWLWRATRGRTGRKAPEAEWFIPPVPGSASDVENAHRGSLAGYEDF